MAKRRSTISPGKVLAWFCWMTRKALSLRLSCLLVFICIHSPCGRTFCSFSSRARAASDCGIGETAAKTAFGEWWSSKPSANQAVPFESSELAVIDVIPCNSGRAILTWHLMDLGPQPPTGSGRTSREG